MSDDTPTQRFDQPAAAGTNAPEKRRGLIPILIVIGALILVGIVVIVMVLLTRPSGAPIAAGTNSPIPSASATTTPPAPSATPTPTPSASHTNAPPPVQSTNPAFTTFAPDLSKYSCSSGPYYSGPTPIVKVTWVTVRTASVWIVQGTSDAADSGFMQIPLSGDQSEFSSPLDLACDPPTSTYTITLVGTNGKHVSKSWTVVNAHPTE
jgi:hypothetical protein